MDENKLLKWAIARKNTDAHRKNVIAHMKLKYGENVEGLLPPIFFIDINELSDEEIRLLDNMTHIFFKGEVCGVDMYVR